MLGVETMDWDRIKQRLEAALNAPLDWTVCPEQDWNEWLGAQGVGYLGRLSVESGGKLYFKAYKEGRNVHALTAARETVTEPERRLVELLLESLQAHGKKTAATATEEEKKVLEIRDWCNRQLEMGLTDAELPDSLAGGTSLYAAKVPFLLSGEFSHSRRVTDRDLKKLLESFFDAEVILVPLKEKEWLILGADALLTASGAGANGEEETVEEALTAIGSGLYDMLANEWVGECHLAVHYPMIPTKSLLATIVQLRETMRLGRAFHLGSNIHLPWELRLEKLLSVVPETDKHRFLELTLGRADRLLDAETMATLETYFELDCNVSETAKKLYIHRNTLLYRLDKFKQETGLDVRNFSDAVLVKVAFLLYKVTKRI
jgi:hypothetical protein